MNNRYTKIQKIMIILLPVIVMLLIAAIVMCFVITFLPMRGGFRMNTGNATIIMSLASSLMAIACIFFIIISSKNEPDDENED